MAELDLEEIRARWIHDGEFDTPIAPINRAAQDVLALLDRIAELEHELAYYQQTFVDMSRQRDEVLSVQTELAQQLEREQHDHGNCEDFHHRIVAGQQDAVVALAQRIAALERDLTMAQGRAEMLIRGLEAAEVITRQFAEEVLDAFEHEVPIGNETIEHARKLAGQA